MSPLFPAGVRTPSPLPPARPSRPRRTRLLALAAAVSLGAAACGASDSGTAAPATTVAAADGGGALTGDNLFPNVNVTNITDGTPLNLQEELAGGDLPVLLWFFAPH